STVNRYEVPLLSPPMSALVAGASTVFDPPFHRTTYLVTVVPLPSAAFQCTVAFPSGPAPLPSLGMVARTPPGASGRAHGGTALEAFDAPTPSPTERTPWQVKAGPGSPSRPRSLALVDRGAA